MIGDITIPFGATTGELTTALLLAGWVLREVGHYRGRDRRERPAGCPHVLINCERNFAELRIQVTTLETQYRTATDQLGRIESKLDGMNDRISRLAGHA